MYACLRVVSCQQETDQEFRGQDEYHPVHTHYTQQTEIESGSRGEQTQSRINIDVKITYGGESEK